MRHGNGSRHGTGKPWFLARFGSVIHTPAMDILIRNPWKSADHGLSKSQSPHFARPRSAPISGNVASAIRIDPGMFQQLPAEVHEITCYSLNIESENASKRKNAQERDTHMTKKITNKKSAPIAAVAAIVTNATNETDTATAVLNTTDSAIDDAILDQVDAKLDALDAQQQQSVSASILTAIDNATSADEAKDFDTLYRLLDEGDKLDKANAIGKAIDDRIEWLKTNKPNNTTQAPKLMAYRKKLAMPSKAAVLLVSGTNEEFINRSISKDSVYNLYAIDKVIDFVNGLAGDKLSNAINRAIFKSMINFKAEGIAFTGEMARAAASDKITVQDKKAKSLLMRHTVDAGTAPTQASSTMAALQTLGVVVNKGTMRAPVYELQDTPVTTKLQQLLAA